MRPEDSIYICVDTETTGLHKMAKAAWKKPSGLASRGSEVCQIGGLILDDNMVPQKLFCHYCDTVTASSSEPARAVHGIDSREVRFHLPGIFLPQVMMMHLPEFFFPNVTFIGYNTEFDMTMIGQTLSNTDVKFTWKPLQGPILPRRGRNSVDIAEFVRGRSYYRKLASFTPELEESRKQFLAIYGRHMSVQTNCPELLQIGWEQQHNAFFDALCTYLLWKERVWRQKLV